ncbi:hypothetical protein IP81_01605 [Novosphingobium sp. AAP83]|nr:hypothetical protein IP81_01605 [Novosphingobium sp. AAP83]
MWTDTTQRQYARADLLFPSDLTGAEWEILAPLLPPDLFPPITTVQHYLYRWSAIGVWKSISHALLLMAREAAGREASPSAGVINS